MSKDTIYREDAIKTINKVLDRETLLYGWVRKIAVDAIRSIPSADRPNGYIHIDDVYRLVAGHSDYHGDSILSAFTCLTEGKDVKPIRPLDRPQEWILCSEKLPEEFVDVLVCLTDGAMYVAQLTDYIDIWGEPKWCTDTSHHCIGGAILSSDIVAWMPLPKSYKGELK